VISITQQLKQQVDHALDNFFAHKHKQFSADGSTLYKQLDVLADFVLQGGKRLRPLLVLGGYLLGGSRVTPRIMKAALAYEIVHAGLLVHDDIIDQDDLRRGNPTVHRRIAGELGDDGDSHDTAAKHHGESIAICIGDLAISMACELLSEGSNYNPTVFSIFQRSLYRVYEGEILDVMTKTRATTIDDILRCYYLKTAWYSFIGPMQMGGSLAGLSSKTLELLQRLGNVSGLAFQILDDITGAFATEVEIGKPVYSDFKENKPTLLTVYALQHASQSDRQFVRDHLGTPSLTAADGSQITDIIKRSGALDYALETVRSYVTEAYDILKKLPCSPSSKGRAVISDVVEYLSSKASQIPS